MIEERQRLESVLEEFRKFVGTEELPGSVVHREYCASTEKELAFIESRILEDEITTLPDLFTLLDNRATRRVLKSNLTSFVDTVANLEARIAQMKLDETTANATQQEKDEDNEQEPEV